MKINKNDHIAGRKLREKAAWFTGISLQEETTRIMKMIWKFFVDWNRAMLRLAIIFLLFDRLMAYMEKNSGVKGSRGIIAKGSTSAYSLAFASLFFLIIPIIVLIIDQGLDRRCTKCKKWFALRRTKGDNLVKCEDIQILKEVKRKDNYGHVIGTQEQYVPGTRKTYHKNYRCCKCGATCFRTYSKDEINT